MADERSEAQRADALRKRAEEILAARGEAGVDLTADQIRGVIHELHTHQIELELQNEELRRTQQELTETRDRLSDLYDLYDHAPVGYATVDANGLIVEANLTFGDMLGIHRSRLPRRRLSSFVVPEDQQALYEHVQVMKETRQRHTVEVRMRGQADAAPLWVRIECTVDERAGDILRFRKAFVDVTERKDAEQARIEMERQIMQAQKIESLGVLAGGIAHDFNNLLMIILGNVEFGLRAARPGAPEREFFNEIKQAARRASELSNQMLAYAGGRRSVIERVDLNALLGKMDHLLRTSIPRTIVLDVATDADLPPIDGDRSQLRQVVLSLVANAAEAIGDNEGTIAVATGSVRADRRTLSAAVGGEGLPEGRYVFLDVADNGCGIDGSSLPRLFDPFFSTKFLGRGLGLAAVHGIMRSHHAAITVCSEPGKGSTFRLLFPACAGAPRPPEVEEAPRQRGLVLVADDEEAVRKVVTLMLERHGLGVITAADGHEAVEVFRDRAGDIDVVLLDNLMPGLSGEEVFAEIHRLRPEVPVILSSGYTRDEATQRFADLPLAGFVQKPFDVKTLLGAIESVLQPQ